MNRHVACACIILTAPLCGSVFAQSGNSQPDRSWGKYQVVFERSIFSRERGRRSAPEKVVQQLNDPNPEVVEESAEPAPAAHLATHFVLIGVSRFDGERTAMFEDRRSAAIHKVSEGDVLAELPIEAISEVDISTIYQGEAVTVKLGQTLAGTAPSAPTPSVSGGSSSSDATAKTSATSGSSVQNHAEDESNLSIIERMRLRRQQELKQ